MISLSLSIRLLIIINLYYLREHTKCRTFFAIHLFEVPHDDDDGKQVSMSVSFEEIVVVGDRGDRVECLARWLI